MAPATTPSHDVRVRISSFTTTSTALSEVQLGGLSDRPVESPSGNCQSVCCYTPMRRPMLNRDMASAHSEVSAKSAYSTGTDGVQSEDDSAGPLDLGENIDAATFEQILEMDDDEDEREFSKSIVYDFFTQAEGTFQKMDSNLEKRDLEQLSALGHFLKGSSATLGLTKVKDSCEKIQHFGAHKDASGIEDELDDDVCLKNCKTTIEQAKKEFAEVELALRRFYREEGS
ncbi:Phosphorelay intermediate protein [Friedmanniomyces endolithicus]|uniref:Phosphorelay intermediate protein n=1 Tax=Friedmanniomyces endolithicus TaxID=329885 RepID=A0AAN6G0G4_9PEZI|nr:Phosphorelay intermediate protein [Friedmanniomyces endolithicus]KAK0296087.1 Phosphorelay intermediate protein [Friedmanniomyces endolithicus]KAK0316733.1 Phosphorelay intermediate protein [Friedmanniomyces endolithicus]KAK0327939.1 Phosphorelay intermediate protein [Friedmanniomyces endolithicus]KAK0834909.1 Phosphorelay intermediate protein [Friedmanniomyces endolithicus]